MTITARDLQRDFGVVGMRDIALASDAAVPSYPSVTAPNSGIPALFNTWTDPKITKAIITPTKSEQIYGQAQKGSWITDTAQFPFVELSGTVSSYGDFSQDGTTDPNANWVQRQSYHYQTWTKWGEREVERMGAAKIDWVNQKNLASISVLNKAENRINLFGIAGLELYGALNDPDIPAAIQPLPKFGKDGKPAAGNTWNDTKDSEQIINDVQELFQELSNNLGGNLTLDDEMTLVVPTERQVALTYVNKYNLKVRDVLKENYPNMKIETLPEAGQMLSGGMSKITQVQLFKDEIDGQRTMTTAFTEKMRAHTVERYSSNVRQKKSQGTWGTIIFYPVAVATMVGV